MVDSSLREWLPGRFLAFEGLDGSGKSTQVRVVARALEASGLRVRTTREPSDGPIGTLLRRALVGDVALPGGERLTPETIAALFVADRADHRARTIVPGCAAGEVVLTDRHVLSSLAYQASECDPAWVAALNAPFPAPDVTVFLDIAPEAALARASAREEAAQIYEEASRLAAVEARYRSALVALEATARVVRVDGSGTVDEVRDRILQGLTDVIRSSG